MGLGMYMRGFFEIASDREHGGRIHWSTIRRWCDARGLTGDDAEDAHFLLGGMDTAYMEWSRTKGKKMSEDRKRLQEQKDAIARPVRR